MLPKNVLLTGASRGIGHAIAIHLIKNHHNIAINCRTPESELFLKEIAQIAQNYNQKCVTFVGDIGDYHCCEEFFQKAVKELGSVDYLINNAGISYIGLLQDMTPDEWNHILQTNLSSVFYCCKLAIPDMIRRQAGKIINISSVWGNCGASCEVAYSATKGGIHAFTRALAKELAPSNIQVNAIACGAIQTQMNQFLSEEERLQLESEIPCGRMGKPDEVADFVLQLLQSNSYLTGQVIQFDGGWI
jgi:3-oxoacyl-[acyl-carrier protein] reductase